MSTPLAMIMRCAVLLALWLPCACAGADLPEIEAVTDEYPPFIYSEGGLAKGPVADVTREIFREAGVTGKITFLPWKRAVSLSEEKPDVLLLILSRTPGREAHFKWVGPVVTSWIRLYKFRYRKDIPAELTALHRYHIGTIRGYASEQRLVDMGFVRGSELDPASSDESNVRKFIAGRIDLIATNDQVLADQLHRQGHDFSEVEAVVTLAPPFIEYMAFSLGTSDKTVAAVRAAYERLRQAGKLSP